MYFLNIMRKFLMNRDLTVIPIAVVIVIMSHSVAFSQSLNEPIQIRDISPRPSFDSRDYLALNWRFQTEYSM